MFTGIVEKVGRVRSREDAGETTRLWIETGFTDLAMGESVAVNGTCLTVTEFDSAGLALFFASRETLRLTNLGALKSGSRVNLERALTLGTRLSGHLVQGHIDGLGTLVEAKPAENGSHELKVRIPRTLARYTIHKGSIALDGVSLTINSLEDLPDGSSDLSFMIIPHTWSHTRLAELKPGDAINVESDLMAKYLERFSQTNERAELK